MVKELPKMYDFSKLRNPPASKEVLERVFISLFTNASISAPVTFQGFSGCGKTAFIRYLSRNYSQLGYSGKKLLFIYLDLEEMSTSKEFWQSSFLESIEYARQEFSEELYSKVSSILEGEFTPSNVVSLLQELTYENDFRICLILDNAHILYTISSEEYTSTLTSLKRINPAKISLSFLATTEYTDEMLNRLGRLKSDFLQNILWSGETPFTKSSVDALLANEEQWNGLKFSLEFVKKVNELSGGDPKVIKILVKKAISQKEFEQSFVKEAELDKIYALIGPKILDDRYYSILSHLQAESLKYLAGDIEKEIPTEYLLKTGLVITNKGSNKLVNSLFDYYVTKEKGLIKKLSHPVDQVDSLKEEALINIRKDLTGQELLLFNYLVDRKGEIVEKDSIAELIWGDSWEDQYSEWAIDKIVSRLRAKLETTSYSIKTYKGKGISLL